MAELEMLHEIMERGYDVTMSKRGSGYGVGTELPGREDTHDLYVESTLRGALELTLKARPRQETVWNKGRAS